MPQSRENTIVHSRPIYQLLIEGASTAAGYGDERKQGGFAGRLDTHYQDWNNALDFTSSNESRSSVLVHRNGLPDISPHKLVQTLPHDIAKARAAIDPHRETRLAAVVAIGCYLDHQAKEKGVSGALEEWELALIGIREIFGAEKIPAVYVTTPAEGKIRTLGRVVDPSLRRMQQELTLGTLQDCIPFETMIGPNTDLTSVTEQGPRHWGVHPNAEGHHRMAACLVPLIDRMFNIQTDPLPPLVSYDPDAPSRPW